MNAPGGDSIIIKPIPAASEADRQAYFAEKSYKGPGDWIGGLAVTNMMHNYGESMFAYTRPESDKVQHVAWIRGNNAGYPGNKSISEADWQEASSDSVILHTTNSVLLDAFEMAQNFMPRRDRCEGVAVDGGKGFGMEMGNWDLGIRVSYDPHVYTLMEILRNGSREEVRDYQVFLAAEFVHEMTHRNYQEGLPMAFPVDMETQAHLVQLLYEPRNNPVFNATLRGTLRHADRVGGLANLKGYDRAQYLATALFASHLIKINPTYAGVFQEGIFAESLDMAQRLLEESDVTALQTEVRDDLLREGDTELMERAEVIAQQFELLRQI